MAYMIVTNSTEIVIFKVQYTLHQNFNLQVTSNRKAIDVEINPTRANPASKRRRTVQTWPELLQSIGHQLNPRKSCCASYDRRFRLLDKILYASETSINFSGMPPYMNNLS